VKTIPAGSKIPVRFTIAERDLIRGQTFYGPDFARVAVFEGKGIKVMLTLEDIDEIQGYVASAANHTKDKNLQAACDKLSDKLQAILERYREE
jgi:hypothetical protein